MVSYIWIKIIQILFLKTLKTLEIAKFRLTEKFSQALLLDYMKPNFNVKYRLKRDSMDFSSIYVTFLSMYVSTSTKSCRKCFDKIFLFTISAWLYTFFYYKKMGFFPCLLYLLNCFIFTYTDCYFLYFLPKLKTLHYLFTLWRFANHLLVVPTQTYFLYTAVWH